MEWWGEAYTREILFQTCTSYMLEVMDDQSAHVCYTPVSQDAFSYVVPCRDGDVRLIPAGSAQNFYLGLTQLTTFDYINTYLSRGRVEMCVGGSYGSVCNSQWDNSAASAVCSQLGFSPYGKECGVHM